MILVVFGSKSDSEVYQPILDTLKLKGIEHCFKVISAHRDPDELDKEVTSGKYDMIIAGAGLAAALPGVTSTTRRLADSENSSASVERFSMAGTASRSMSAPTSPAKAISARATARPPAEQSWPPLTSPCPTAA